MTTILFLCGATWRCNSQAYLWSLLDSALQAWSLPRGCLLPSAVRLFWCKLKILQDCVWSPLSLWGETAAVRGACCSSWQLLENHGVLSGKQICSAPRAVCAEVPTFYCLAEWPLLGLHREDGRGIRILALTQAIPSSLREPLLAATYPRSLACG